MASFEGNRAQRIQQHFEVLEIDLPVITGACTIGSQDGYGTPLSCDQEWGGEYKTYYFTNVNAPILPNSPYRCIKNISEKSAVIKPTEGLAGRGSLSVTFEDFTGQDPNINAPAVNATVKNQGTFFGKLAARQVFDNKEVRLKLYRLDEDGSINLDEADVSQTRHYSAESFEDNGKGTWRINCTDALSVANLGEKNFPLPTNSYLRQDTTDAATVLQVDGGTTYTTGDVIRIGDEFLRVTGIDTSNPSDHKIQVATRGSDIVGSVSGEILTTTEAKEHKSGDSIFICHVSDNETIDELIKKILISADIDPSLIPSNEWLNEVTEWHNFTRINTLFTETESVNEVLKKILNGFLMDLWFDVSENKVKLSAINVWKQSSRVLVEGVEINAATISKRPQAELRASRALVVYDKENLADNDDTASYKKGAQYADSSIIGADIFGEHKDRTFENNTLINKESAEQLVTRYVSRFKYMPFLRSFTTDERYLNYKLGDVVDIQSTVDQGFAGENSKNIRAQIVKINPKYGNTGRVYKVDAMTYDAAFNNNTERILTSPQANTSLWGAAGNPSEAMDITFILNTYAGSPTGAPSIYAGDFAHGSKITIIMVDGYTAKGKGGDGGAGGDGGFPYNNSIQPAFHGKDGVAGGVVYDAQNVNTDIYLSGETPSTTYPYANGYLLAPNGGNGGNAAQQEFTTGTPHEFWPNHGGDGGNGREVGIGGATGAGSNPILDGQPPSEHGSIEDDGTGWGVAGVAGVSTSSNVGTANGGAAGAAGKGIVTGSATVRIFGSSAARFVNGNGDAVTIM